MAVEGLEETRTAVHALRDEPVDLAEQVAALAAREGAGLTVVGPPRALGTDAGLAVYRAAQEALTNARKHSPGAEVSVRLDFTPETTVLVVDNGATTDVVAKRAGGYRSSSACRACANGSSWWGAGSALSERHRAGRSRSRSRHEGPGGR